MSPAKSKKPRFFATQGKFRDWLAKHHKAATELEVGYYKVTSGKPSMTWSESVDQALCYGWIDGVRHSIDDISYRIRFTPRKPKSKWSDVNLKKVEVLKRKRLMRAAGTKAYEARIEGRRAGYAYEANTKAMSRKVERTFKANKAAWEFFQQQAPSWRKKILHWLTSGKQEATNLRRLDKLMAHCEAGKRLM